MRSVIRLLFIFKNRISIILLMILQVVHSMQIDFYNRRVSVMDCLNADKKDIELFLQKDDKNDKGVINDRAKYILSELFTSSGRNVSSSNISENDYYSYARHQNAVRNTILTLAPHLSLSIMLITTDCQSNTRKKYEILLEDHFVNCQTLSTTNFNPIEIIESFNTYRVKMAVLMVPRLLIKTFLEIGAKFQVESFIYITVDYDPRMIREIQKINPLLTFYNLNLVNASDLSKNEMVCRMNQTKCSLSADEILHRDDYHIFVCYYPLPRILQIVTITIGNNAFLLPKIYPHQNQCEIGLPCKRKSRARKISSDTKYEWDWACCGGREIDKLTVVLNDIRIPFSIYIREDGHFGSFENGSWDGLVNDLYTGKADLAVAGLAITRDRFTVIDYIFERSERTPITILLRRPDVDVEILNFSFIPKDGKDQIAFLVLLHLTVFLVVYVFECIAFHKYNGQKYNFKDSWSFVGAILFQRDIGGLATLGWGGRILALTYACAMTVLISTYTATLTAENIDYEDIPEFKGLRDKIFQDPTKRVGLWRYGTHEDIANKYNHTAQRFNVMEYKKAAEQLVEKKLDAIFGSIWDIERAYLSKTHYCKDLILHTDEIETEDESWGYQDNSKFGHLISLSILRLSKTNAFDHIENKWRAISSCQKNIPKRYPWQYAGGLIICLLVTIGACVIILASETIFILLRRKKARSYSVSNQK